MLTEWQKDYKKCERLPADLYSSFLPQTEGEYLAWVINFNKFKLRERARDSVLALQRQYNLSLLVNESYEACQKRIRLKRMKEDGFE